MMGKDFYWYASPISLDDGWRTVWDTFEEASLKEYALARARENTDRYQYALLSFKSIIENQVEGLAHGSPETPEVMGPDFYVPLYEKHSGRGGVSREFSENVTMHYDLVYYEPDSSAGHTKQLGYYIYVRPRLCTDTSEDTRELHKVWAGKAYSQRLIDKDYQDSNRTEVAWRQDMFSYVLTSGGWFDRVDGKVTDDSIRFFISETEKYFPHVYDHTLYAALPDTSLSTLEMSYKIYRE